MVGGDEGAVRAGHRGDVVLVTVAGAVVHDQVPRERRTGQCAVLRVRGRAGEGDRVVHLPGGRGRGRGDRRARRGAADGDHGVGRVGATPAVVHTQADGDLALLRVGPRHGDGGGVAVDPVAVEIPGVRQGVAVRVTGGRGVEVD